MQNQLDALIEILLDPSAREDEREDAAMDLCNYDDEKVIEAWLKVISNPNEKEYIVSDCCEYFVRHLLIKKKQSPELIKSIINTLPELSRIIANYYLNNFINYDRNL